MTSAEIWHSRHAVDVIPDMQLSSLKINPAESPWLSENTCLALSWVGCTYNNLQRFNPASPKAPMPRLNTGNPSMTTNNRLCHAIQQQCTALPPRKRHKGIDQRLWVGQVGCGGTLQRPCKLLEPFSGRCKELGAWVTATQAGQAVEAVSQGEGIHGREEGMGLRVFQAVAGRKEGQSLGEGQQGGDRLGREEDMGLRVFQAIQGSG